MKKIITVILTIITGLATAQTTATDFTCNDCVGNSHTLFNELNTGKIIALVWVMPCGTCVGPSLTTYNVVQSYSLSTCPVEFWLCDDYANTNCTTLSNWANSNGMTNSKKFSNSLINMMDYGSTGMPKVVIVGGPSHKVYYNANNTVNSTSMQAAITQACTDIVSGVVESENKNSFSPEIYPNPVVKNTAVLTYNIDKPGDISIDIYNVVGQKTMEKILKEHQTQGAHSLEIVFTGLKTGIYFLCISDGIKSEYIKVIIE